MSDVDLIDVHPSEPGGRRTRDLSTPTPLGDKPTHKQIPRQGPPLYGHDPTAWFLSWAGITVSGGAFGLLAGILLAVEERESVGLSLLGGVAGIILAAFIGAPVVINMAIVSWLLWLSRFHRTMSALAGASTGMISTAMLFRGDRSVIAYQWQLLVITAGVIGALGGYAPARWYWSKRIRAGTPEQGNSGWQFSLGDLFVRFTVASLLLLVWITIGRLVLASR